MSPFASTALAPLSPLVDPVLTVTEWDLFCALTFTFPQAMKTGLSGQYLHIAGEIAYVGVSMTAGEWISPTVYRAKTSFAWFGGAQGKGDFTAGTVEFETADSRLYGNFSADNY